jgi:endonuclease/exonuclease/phosphatase family metal-dependent hydrolase
MKIYLFVFSFFISFLSYSQDTLTVLQYNLLWYGEVTDWCDNSNNNINEKDQYIRTIINYTEPDIFTVNEMSKSPAIHQHLLDQVLNTGGVSHYQKANFLSEAETDIVNMLYFNAEKLALHSHFIAQNYIRDIDVYKLYLISNSLADGDTTFVTCVVSHLKSSSSGTNVEKRRVMEINTMNWLNDFDDDNNYLMMGDFNVYSPTEPAYQQFLNYENPSLRFLDPVDQTGEWHNNSQYSHVHSQSTHTSSNGCASTGGMDDRFDFILISNNISEGNKKVKYLPGSYWAVGQDGKHFNKSLIASPENTSVPPDVLNALYNNSDHLPITLKLVVEESLGIPGDRYTDILEINIINPISDYLQFDIKTQQSTHLKMELIDFSGNVLKKLDYKVARGTHRYEWKMANLKSGMYLLKVTDSNNYSVVEKLIKL